MASVTLELGVAPFIRPFISPILGYASWTFNPGTRPSIGTALSADGSELFFNSLVLPFTAAHNVELLLSEQTDLGTDPGHELSDRMETSGTITLTASDGSSIVLSIGDSTEPYSWVPSNAAAVYAFTNTINGLTDQSLTIVLDDHAPQGIVLSQATLKVGAEDVARAYLGDVLVYGSAPPAWGVDSFAVPDGHQLLGQVALLTYSAGTTIGNYHRVLFNHGAGGGSGDWGTLDAGSLDQDDSGDTFTWNRLGWRESGQIRVVLNRTGAGSIADWLDDHPDCRFHVQTESLGSIEWDGSDMRGDGDGYVDFNRTTVWTSGELATAQAIRSGAAQFLFAVTEPST